MIHKFIHKRKDKHIKRLPFKVTPHSVKHSKATRKMTLNSAFFESLKNFYWQSFLKLSVFQKENNLSSFNFSATIYHRIQKVWPPPLPPPSIVNLSYMAIHLPILSFSESPVFENIANEIPDKHKNKLVRQNYFFILRKLKNNVKCYFDKQHQGKISSKIITISSNEIVKRKTKIPRKNCWVKSITATKSIHY